MLSFPSFGAAQDDGQGEPRDHLWSILDCNPRRFRNDVWWPDQTPSLSLLSVAQLSLPGNQYSCCTSALEASPAPGTAVAPQHWCCVQRTSSSMPACLPLLRSVLPNTLSLGLSQLEQQVSEESPPRTLPVGGWNQPAILTSCSGTSISSVGSAKWWFLTTASFSRYKFLCCWQKPRNSPMAGSW